MTLITTCTGRLVYGHPLIKVQKTVKQNGKRVPKLKPDGRPVMVHMFGVAFTKPDFNASIWPTMWAEGSALYNGNQPPQRFAWKYKDGDGIDAEGKPYNTREGYPGCMVIHFETEFDINGFRPGQSGAWDQITERDMKTGDYIAVNVNIIGNKPTDADMTPGLYTNPMGILHIGDGAAIINAPSADQMFGGQQFALPPGATAPGAAPQMPQGMPTPPGMGQPPQQHLAHPFPQYTAPPAMQQPVAAPQYQPPGPVYGQPPQPQYAPAPDIVQQVMPQYQPPQPQYAPPVAAPYPQPTVPGQMPPGFPPR